MSADDESTSFSEIVCTQSDEAVCKIQTDDGTEYFISIGDFTDARLFGRTEDGIVIQGFRLNYD
jgi:hypothetical protein